jgi:hypothetical protein
MPRPVQRVFSFLRSGMSANHSVRSSFAAFSRRTMASAAPHASHSNYGSDTPWMVRAPAMHQIVWVKWKIFWIETFRLVRLWFLGQQWVFRRIFTSKARLRDDPRCSISCHHLRAKPPMPMSRSTVTAYTGVYVHLLLCSVNNSRELHRMPVM